MFHAAKRFTLMAVMAVVIFLTSSVSYAGGKVCRLPKDCLEVLGTEFSTGGGKSSIWYVEVLCRTPNGLRVYIDGNWGLRLFGRWSIPKSIDLVPGNGQCLDCDF